MSTLATIGALQALNDMRGHMDARGGQPVLNVKCHVWADSIPWDQLRDEFDHVDTVREWATTLERSDYETTDRAREWAQRVWWEDAQELARETFGESARVYSAGRQGGWLYVDSVGEPESWTVETCPHIQAGAEYCYDWDCQGVEIPDVEMVERWVDFARNIEAMVEGFPYMVGWELVSDHDSIHEAIAHAI